MSGQNRWLRLSINWDDSEWLVDLSPASQLAWIKLLCYVKASGVRGTAGALSARSAAKRWGIPTADINTMLGAAEADGALSTEDGAWIVTNWLTYQPYDATNAQRAARHRAKKGHLRLVKPEE